MAIKTMSMSEGNGQYAAGWHELTISKAEYSDWKEDKVIDIWFQDYPVNFNVRVFPAYNKESKEEFSIARLFRVANAGIVSVLKDAGGKHPVIQYDDDISGLVDKKVNVLLHKEKGSDGKEYSSPFNRFAPVTQNGDHLSYSSDDVSYWKTQVEKGLKAYLAKKQPKEEIPW